MFFFFQVCALTPVDHLIGEEYEKSQVHKHNILPYFCTYLTFQPPLQMVDQYLR